MKLSIITINLNNAAGLRKTIESVVNQSYEDIEYIVIDGGSTDNSTAIINEFADRLTYWVSEPDKGIYNAMNKGIINAHGEYLQFLNSGDWLADKDVLNQIFSGEQDSDLLFGDLYKDKISYESLHKFPEDISLAYLMQNTIGHPSTFIRKTLFETIGLYDEKYKIVSDWKFFVQAIANLHCTKKHLHTPIAVFRLDGICSLPENQIFIEVERKKVLSEILQPFQRDYPTLNARHHNSFIARAYNKISTNSLLRKVFSFITHGILSTERKITNRLSPGKIYILSHQLLSIIPKSHKVDFKNIPIIINNYNRLECLLKLIDSLIRRGYKNIHIIDNNSTYLPLLAYYETCPYTIYRLKINAGQMALWQTELYKKFIYNYYVYTDPDIIPVEECPDDFMANFIDIINRYPSVSKVGFSMKLDDIPDFYRNKEKVLKRENLYFTKEPEKGFFLAPVETKFALYRPFAKGAFETKDIRNKAIRTGYPYEARHLSWYVSEDELSLEEDYYRKTSKLEIGNWN